MYIVTIPDCRYNGYHYDYLSWYHASYGFMTSLLRTSRAKLLGMPCFQPGTSKVEVWHHGLRASSFSIVAEKHDDHSSRGNARTVSSMRDVLIRFARRPTLSSGHGLSKGLGKTQSETHQ